MVECDISNTGHHHHTGQGCGLIARGVRGGVGQHIDPFLIPIHPTTDQNVDNFIEIIARRPPGSTNTPPTSSSMLALPASQGVVVS